MAFFNFQNQKFGNQFDNYLLEGNEIYDRFYKIYSNYISITKIYIKNLNNLLNNNNKTYHTIQYISIFLVLMKQIIELKKNSLEKQISILEQFNDNEKLKNENLENRIQEIKNLEVNLNKEINVLNEKKENYNVHLKNMEKYLIQYFIENNDQKNEPKNKEWKNKLIKGKKILMNYMKQINKTEEMRKNYEIIKRDCFNYITLINMEKIKRISNSFTTFLQSFIEENKINKIRYDNEKSKFEKIPLDSISFSVEMNQFYKYNEIKFIPYQINIEKDIENQEFKDLIPKLKLKYNSIIASIIDKFQQIYNN